MRLRHIPGCEEFIEKSKDCISGEDVYKSKGSWHKVFENDKPIQIEIGMGKGQFIRNMSISCKDKNFIGIERYETVLMKALQRKHKYELEYGNIDNLLFMCADAMRLSEIFEAKEVDKIFLNFSDPWPKKRYAKRRLTSPVFLNIYDKILKPDGVLEFKTDDIDLFSYSLESIPESGWEIIYKSFDFHAEAESKNNIMTEYEEKFSKKGQKICKLVAKRNKY